MSLIRTAQRAALRKIAVKPAAVMESYNDKLAENERGGFFQLHATKGYRHFSEKRLRAIRMTADLRARCLPANASI